MRVQYIIQDIWYIYKSNLKVDRLKKSMKGYISHRKHIIVLDFIKHI